jgi:hypothetical protein
VRERKGGEHLRSTELNLFVRQLLFDFIQIRLQVMQIFVGVLDLRSRRADQRRRRGGGNETAQVTQSVSVGGSENGNPFSDRATEELLSLSLF